MFVRQRVKALTHVVKLLSFLQNCILRHFIPDFLNALRRGELQVR
jgi:hypothetical protein